MEIALMRHFDVRANIIVPNVSFGICIQGKSLHECDLLILTPSGYATEIEIKISKADLLKDKKKKHTHNHIAITNFYYAVPEELIDFASENIPSEAGLISVYEKDGKNKCSIIRGTERRKPAYKWNDTERLKLLRLGTMRIVGLKENIAKK